MEPPRSIERRGRAMVMDARGLSPRSPGQVRRDDPRDPRAAHAPAPRDHRRTSGGRAGHHHPLGPQRPGIRFGRRPVGRPAGPGGGSSRSRTLRTVFGKSVACPPAAAFACGVWNESVALRRSSARKGARYVEIAARLLPLGLPDGSPESTGRSSASSPSETLRKDGKPVGPPGPRPAG